MRKKAAALVITFAATTDAMAMESFCAHNGLPGRLIPLPREISAGCGLSWKALPKDEERLTKLITENGLHWDSMRVIEI